MPIFRGTNNIKKIFRGNNEIVKVFRGTNLIFTSGLPQYEELADINVTTATTQIDFDNLNITKDDELRLVFTFNSTPSTTLGNLYSLYVNNFNTSSNYGRQLLVGVGSSISAGRSNDSIFSEQTNLKASGFVGIKVSNNDRLVAQSQDIRGIGTGFNSMENRSWNIVGTQTVTSITKISVEASRTDGIAVGSRLQLYKVNTGVA